MNVVENKSLAELTTMQLGGNARYLTEAHTKNDIVKAIDWAKKKDIAFKVIGGGSNLIVTDEGFPGLIILNMIRGIVATESIDGELVLSCGAGESWDDVVAYSVQLHLTGIEALSLIPGTVGATPVQNVGAYGQEVSETILQVEAYDTRDTDFIVLDADDCAFGYRDSIFKNSQKDRYIITGVSFKLKKGSITSPLYKSLEEYLHKHNINTYSPDMIREAVIAVRTFKLPDPAEIANTGSFFKNPVITQSAYDALQQEHPEIPGFHVHDGIKVPAGWLLESAGLKDYDHGNGMATYKNHALVIVNKSANNYSALADLKSHLVNTVEAKYGIILEQEPETL